MCGITGKHWVESWREGGSGCRSGGFCGITSWRCRFCLLQETTSLESQRVSDENETRFRIGSREVARGITSK